MMLRPGIDERALSGSHLRHTLALLAAAVPALVALGCGAPADESGEPEADPEQVETAEDGLCSGDCPVPATPTCADTCNYASDCSKPCEGSDGAQTTCGGVKICRTCSSTCTTSAACNATCKSGSTITSCGNFGTCKKYDVYCAYPVLTEASVWDNNESGTGGAQAYMYFDSATSPKSGSYPSHIGGLSYDPLSSWASNFRGPMKVAGESARPQWEFFDSGPFGLDASYGSAGAPFIYGKQCLSVVAGAATPTLTTRSEHVYEDDECFAGICNPDDWVGQFTIDRSYCNTEVFGTGSTGAWSSVHAAAVTSDLKSVKYKLWCSACKSSWTASCASGVSL